MNRFTKVLLIVLSAGLLGFLSYPQANDTVFYNSQIPAAAEDAGVIGNLASAFAPKTAVEIPVTFSSADGQNLEFLIETTDKVPASIEDNGVTSEGAKYVAEKVEFLFEDRIRAAGIADNLVNIFLVASGDNYILRAELADSLNLEDIKALMPTSVTFENGWLSWIQNKEIRLGLDLQGGVQLDYNIDLSRVDAEDIDSIVQGNLAVVERRVNSLGVSEPNIYVSEVGSEKHIVVELAGIRSVEEAKATIGKTVQLEFKEPMTASEQSSSDEMQTLAQAALSKLQGSADSFKSEALQYHSDNYDDGVRFEELPFTFVSELSPTELATAVANMQPGDISSDLVKATISYSYDAENQALVPKSGLYIIKLVDESTDTHEVDEDAQDFTKTAEAVLSEKQGLTAEAADAQISYGSFSNDQIPASLKPLIEQSKINISSDLIEEDSTYALYAIKEKQEAQEEEVRASHILISYAGAQRAASDVTRTREEALALANEVAARAQSGEDFTALAQEFSSGTTASTGGDLGFFPRGRMTQAFEDAAFGLQVGQISGAVETEFGFHIIKLTDRKEATPEKWSLLRLALSKTDDNKAYLENVLTNQLRSHKVTKEERKVKLQTLLFPLEADTWKSTGLDGSHFKHASVELDQQTFDPYVSISFDDEGAALFSDLTARLVGQPIAIYVGGELISAPNVSEKIPNGIARITGNYTRETALQLANDLNSGAIPAPLETPSEYVVSPTLGADALTDSLYAGIIGLIIVAIYMVLYYRLPGLLAAIALTFYSMILIVILKYSSVLGISFVMTLAGVAGVVLSIGMAVDANILIFERLKEELRSGKNLSTAIALGFDRAWSSIRDSNLSSLITCTILYWFGTSIIRGFAIMLALGIVVSMFTAITLSRGLLLLFVRTKMSKNRWLFGDNTNTREEK